MPRTMSPSSGAQKSVKSVCANPRYSERGRLGVVQGTFPIFSSQFSCIFTNFANPARRTFRATQHGNAALLIISHFLTCEETHTTAFSAAASNFSSTSPTRRKRWRQRDGNFVHSTRTKKLAHSKIRQCRSNATMPAGASSRHGHLDTRLQLNSGMQCD